MYFCANLFAKLIQRVQTLYLLLVVIISSVMAYGNQNVLQWIEGFNLETYYYVSIALLALYAIVMYKKRNIQVWVNRFTLLLNILLIGSLVFFELSLPGGISPEKGIEFIAPLANIVFLLLANRNIKKDIELVKSVDRIR